MVSVWLRAAVISTALVLSAGGAQAKTVFLGGSQTAGWKHMGMFKVVVIKGAVSKSSAIILQGVGPVLAQKPEIIFMLEGINELYSPNASILARYREILLRINKGSPQTMIFVQSVLPVLNRPDLSNAKITDLNTGLRALCSEMQHCVYIDLYSHFAVNGALNESLTTDGVHLRPDGYKLWQALIEKYVTQPNDQLSRPETVAGLDRPQESSAN